MSSHLRPLPARRGLALLLTVGVLGAPGTAWAQTAPSPAPSAPAAPLLGQRTDGTFTDFGFGETALRGTYGSAELFFPLPAGTRPEGESLVELDLQHSPLLTPRSTLTVTAGGVAVASTRLLPAAAGGSRLVARVPAALVGRTGLALGLRTFLRLTEDECEETTNPALWATVRGSSTARLGTAAVRYDLKETADLLVGRDGRTPVSVELPASAGPEALEAAGYAAARVGRWQGERGGDARVRLASETSAGSRVVIAPGAATPEGFPVTWAGSSYAAGGRSLPGDEGLLAIAEGAPARLLVGGADDEATRQAARALARPATVAALGGAVAALTGEEPADLPRSSRPWQKGAASFAQLGIGRQEVVGAGPRELRLTFDRPAGWRVREQARLDLVLDAGAALASGASTVQVTLGDVDLGSRRLAPGVGPRTYEIPVPAGLVDRRLDGRPLRSLELVLRFVLDVEEQACDAIDPTAVRAAVLPTTTIRLPHEPYEGRDLGRFPHPLADGRGDRVAVVLPDDADDATLSAGLQAAAAVGRWSAADAEPPLLVRASDVPDDVSGMVLLGDAAEQAGVRVNLGRPAVEPADGQAVAVLGLVDGPGDEDRTALVVTGEPAGLLLAATALGSRDGLGLLRGKRVALTGSRPPASLETATGATAPPELAPVVGGRFYEEVRSWTVPAIVIGLGLLVALGLVVRYRWRPAARPVA